MRKTVLLFLVFFSVECSGAPGLSTITLLNPVIPSGKNISSLPIAPAEFVKMKVKDVEKLAERKLKLKEKIAIKIFQAKVKKEIKHKEKGTYSKRSKTAFILSILSLATIILIPLSIVLAVISIILASKSLKANDEDRKAKTALGLSILALGIIVVGLMIYGIFISDGAFKLFIIN